MCSSVQVSAARRWRKKIIIHSHHVRRADPEHTHKTWPDHINFDLVTLSTWNSIIHTPRRENRFQWIYYYQNEHNKWTVRRRSPFSHTTLTHRLPFFVSPNPTLLLRRKKWRKISALLNRRSQYLRLIFPLSPLPLSRSPQLLICSSIINFTLGWMETKRKEKWFYSHANCWNQLERQFKILRSNHFDFERDAACRCAPLQMNSQLIDCVIHLNEWSRSRTKSGDNKIKAKTNYCAAIRWPLNGWQI